MPPKKKEDDTMAEEKSKKSAQGGSALGGKNARAKKITPPVEVKEVPTSAASSSASTSTSKSSSKKHGSSGGATLFIIIVLLIAVVGVYAYQKKQTDSVVSKLSTLESKLSDKIGEIEDGIDIVKQKAEEEKMNAIADATTKKYTSAKYDYSFIYPTRYKVVSVNTNIDETYKEQIVLMRDFDVDLYADSLEGGPMISFQIYTNTENLPLVDWLSANEHISNVAEETELLDMTIDEQTAYSYTWEGLGSASAVAVSFDGYVLLGTGWYMNDTNIDIRDDFQAMVQSLSL